MENVDIYVFNNNDVYTITCDEWYLYHLINFKIYDSKLLPNILEYTHYICKTYNKNQCVHFIGQ